MYTYPILQVNLRNLHESNLKIEAIVRVFAPIPRTQLALCVQDNY